MSKSTVDNTKSGNRDFIISKNIKEGVKPVGNTWFCGSKKLEVDLFFQSNYHRLVRNYEYSGLILSVIV